MADVFLSYERTNADLISHLVDVLREHGVSVWWDRSIEHNADFGAEIDREIDRAKVVVICWSATSVASTWVRGEAIRALDQNKDVGVMLEKCVLPTPFNTKNQIGLSGWSGDADHPSVLNLIGVLGTRLGRGDLIERVELRRRDEAESERRIKVQQQVGRFKERQRQSEEDWRDEKELTKGRRTPARIATWVTLPATLAAICALGIIFALSWRDAHGTFVRVPREQGGYMVYTPDGGGYGQDPYPSAIDRPYTVASGNSYYREDCLAGRLSCREYTPQLAQIVSAPTFYLTLVGGFAMALAVVLALTIVAWLIFKGFRRTKFLRRYMTVRRAQTIGIGIPMTLWLVYLWFSVVASSSGGW